MRNEDSKAPAATASIVDNALRKYSEQEFNAWGKADAFAAGYSEGRAMADDCQRMREALQALVDDVTDRDHEPMDWSVQVCIRNARAALSGKSAPREWERPTINDIMQYGNACRDGDADAELKWFAQILGKRLAAPEVSDEQIRQLANSDDCNTLMPNGPRFLDQLKFARAVLALATRETK